MTQLQYEAYMLGRVFHADCIGDNVNIIALMVRSVRIPAYTRFSYVHYARKYI